MTNYTPIIVFADSSLERDYLRRILNGMDRRIVYFDNETICFDNLKSIAPQFIVLRTDSGAVVWRFIFALQVLKSHAQLLILSNVVNLSHFQLNGVPVAVRCLSVQEASLPKHLERVADQSADFKRSPPELLVGATPFIRNINAMLPTLAQSRDPILITGASGTGKELLARKIVHQAASDSIFIKINCETIPPENHSRGFLFKNPAGKAVSLLFQNEKMPSGTKYVLLHKINRLDEDAQSEVLFLLDGYSKSLSSPSNNGGSGVRVIATSEVDLSHLVQQCCFRKDLFYRLNVIPLYLPPLQMRKDDIQLLVDYFTIAACAKMNRSFIIPADWCRNRIQEYHWPGNIDELKRAVARYVISGDETQIFAHVDHMAFKKDAQAAPCQLFENEIMPNSVEIHSSFLMPGNQSLKTICDRFACRTEMKIMRKALESTNWNRKKAAALLNISYKSMLNKMKMYEIV